MMIRDPISHKPPIAWAWLALACAAIACAPFAAAAPTPTPPPTQAPAATSTLRPPPTAVPTPTPPPAPTAAPMGAPVRSGNWELTALEASLAPEAILRDENGSFLLAFPAQAGHVFLVVTVDTAARADSPNRCIEFIQAMLGEIVIEIETGDGSTVSMTQMSCIPSNSTARHTLYFQIREDQSGGSLSLRFDDAPPVALEVR